MTLNLVLLFINFMEKMSLLYFNPSFRLTCLSFLGEKLERVGCSGPFFACTI